MILLLPPNVRQNSQIAPTYRPRPAYSLNTACNQRRKKMTFKLDLDQSCI